MIYVSSDRLHSLKFATNSINAAKVPLIEKSFQWAPLNR